MRTIMALAVLVAGVCVNAQSSAIAIGVITKPVNLPADRSSYEKARGLLNALEVGLIQRLQSLPTIEFYDRGSLGDLGEELSNAASVSFNQLSGPSLGQLRRLDILVVIEPSSAVSFVVKALEVQSSRIFSTAICESGLITKVESCLPSFVDQLRGAVSRLHSQKAAQYKKKAD